MPTIPQSVCQASKLFARVPNIALNSKTNCGAEVLPRYFSYHITTFPSLLLAETSELQSRRGRWIEVEVAEGDEKGFDGVFLSRLDAGFLYGAEVA
jgi:hypothetical protein